MRARIDGTGPGAVRHCEFSDDSFVEPIMCWEAPNRLSFEVPYQPQPMKGSSICDQVHPPTAFSLDLS